MSKHRKKIVVGNWKMNKSIAEAADLASAIRRELADFLDADVALCPPFTALKSVGEIIDNSPIKLGAQNMHWEADGAFTGEVSAAMLRDLYCRYVILGHSERRAFFGETDAGVNRKVKAALATTLIPIVCVGERLEDRDGGRTFDVVREQVKQGLGGIPAADLAKTILAYEPVWAIGTGRTATPAQAQEVHAFIRGVLSDMADTETAQTMRILYGGSMKPANAAELMKQPDIDGGLIGGAALEPRPFVEIVRAAVA